MTSVAAKANTLLKEGRVDVEDPTFSLLRGIVITTKENETREHDILIWRDGHFTCTCTNFIYSKADSLNLWGEETRVKPECSHVLAVKMTREYRAWIRMIVVPTDEGFALRSVELIDDIEVKSLYDTVNVKKLFPKVKLPSLNRKKRRFSIDDVFGGEHD